jgi:iron complex transport system substrate-binding protein
VRWLALLCLGVALPAQAGRVVTLAPHLAELVCAAGACDQLVASVAHTDYPPAAARLPQVGDAFAVNLEALLALQPDQVIAWDGGTPPALIARLRQLGLSVHPLGVGRIDDVAAALLDLGERLGTPAAARQAAAAFRDRLARLAAAYAGRPPLRAMYQIETDPVFSVNRDSPISEALALCGAVNVFADLPQIAAPVGREALLAARPQVVVFGIQDDAAAIRALWAGWPPPRPALVAVDASLLARPSPRMLDGVEDLCRQLDVLRDQMTSPPASRASTRAQTNR